jgi:hypothetical protein
MSQKSQLLNLKTKLKGAYQVCYDCGTKYGEIRNMASTMWNGECDVCGENKAVTEARDYGFLWKGIREVDETLKSEKEPETKYSSRIQQIEISRIDAFGGQYTTVKTDDEGGGPFLIIEAEAGEVRLDFEEFDEVVKAVQILREQFS